MHHWDLPRSAHAPNLGQGDYRRIFAYFVPYRGHGALVLIAIAAAAALGLVPPLLIRAVIDDALPARDTAFLTFLVLGMILAPFAAGLVGVGQSYLASVVGQRIMFDLRNQMYTHLQRMSLRFYTTTRTGDVMSRLNDDVGGIQNVVTGTLVTVVSNGIVSCTTLAMIAVLDWRLTLVGAALLPLFIWPTKKAGRLRRRIAAQTQARHGELTSHMHETLSISGFLLVRSFAQEAFEAARFRGMSGELARLNLRQAMVGRWFFLLLGLYGAIGPAVVYWYGGRLVIQGELSIGTVVAFVTLLVRLFGPASALASVHVDLTASLALFERIFAYLDLKPEIADRRDARPLGRSRGRISFEDVSFSYDGRRTAVAHVSFSVEPGQLAALVGPSGAGKTTITSLLTRLYDPTGGVVRIDGHDLREVRLDSLAQQFGIVPQDPFLFHDTVRYNVAYGRPDASDAEVIQACAAAQIHDYVASLPEGYDTVVGERGHRLSGGEKQRVAIARVLLKDPSILILDEATSSVDSSAEALIQEAIRRLTAGRTTIAIAHRLSTIVAADVSLVVQHGRLVEAGTHQELLAQGGAYARLHDEQFKAVRRVALDFSR